MMLSITPLMRVETSLSIKVVTKHLADVPLTVVITDMETVRVIAKEDVSQAVVQGMYVQLIVVVKEVVIVLNHNLSRMSSSTSNVLIGNGISKPLSSNSSFTATIASLIAFL